MNSNDYKETLYDIKSLLGETTQPIEYIDTAKMSKKEKDTLIRALQDKIHHLQMELMIRKSVDERYIKGLLNSKNSQIIQLLHNPIFTLPSGNEIDFNSLSASQLKYLESLSEKPKTK